MADTWPVYSGDPRHEKKWLTGLGNFPPPVLNLGAAAAASVGPTLGQGAGQAFYSSPPVTFGGPPTTPDRGAMIFPNRNPSDYSLGTPVGPVGGGDPRNEANAYARNYQGGQPQGPQYVQTTRDPRAGWLSSVKTFANDLLGQMGAYGDQIGLHKAGLFTGPSKPAPSGGGMTTVLIVGGLAAAAYLLVKK